MWQNKLLGDKWQMESAAGTSEGWRDTPLIKDVARRWVRGLQAAWAVGLRE